MRLSTKIFIGFALIIMFSVIGSSVDIKLSEEVHRNTDFLTQSESIIRISGRIHKTIIEMQSGFRGYLLTDNENFLEPYYRGFKEVPLMILEEKKLLASSSSQHQKIDSIKVLHDQWLQYSSSLIGAKRKMILGGNKVSKEYKFLFENKLQKEVGKKINDQISDKFKEFDKFEYTVRMQRRDMLEKSITNTRMISMMIAVLVFSIGIISSIYITFLISRRIMSMVNLADRISKGEFKFIEDKENDELTRLSESLNIMSGTLSKNFAELEKKNKELDQFAYVVSHDLKAPLRGLYNVFAWIEEDLGNEVSSALGRFHEMMKGRIHRLENLITGLLEYARIGRETHNIEPVDLKSLLREIIDVIVPSNFKVEIGNEMPVINTEKIRIEQVFSNLLSNAVKYHGGSNGNIRISCTLINGYYEFSVSDDGVGIPSVYHEKIFQIFQTLREKNQVESTGIGLTIVKKIIEEHKGNIKVISDVGKGASFVFTWPK
jgi:signal transduction histidine kinase